MPPTTTTTVAAGVVSEAVPTQPTLPVTGTDAGSTAMIGLFMLSAGLTLWALSRRPRPIGN